MNIGDLLERYGAWTVRRRGVAALGCLLITVSLVVTTVSRLAQGVMPIDFTPQALFMDQSPEMLRLLEIERTFGREDNDLVLVVDGLSDHGDTVTTLRALHGAMASHPAVERVDSLVNAQVAEQEEGRLRVLSPLDELPVGQALERVARDPVLGGMLVSPDGSATALRVRIERERSRVGDLAPVVHDLVGAAQAIPLPPGATLHATGVPFVRVDVVDLMLADQAAFLPLVSLLFAVTICLLFRRLWLGLSILLCVLLADVWATGMLVSCGATFNVLSLLVPTLVVVIGSSDGIHVASRYREELERSGGEREPAMALALRHVTVACFLTSFTTAAGFGSLVVAETRVVREFGIHCAVAVMVTFVALMVVLPTMLAFLPAHRVMRRVGPRPGDTALGQRALARLDVWVRRWPVRVLTLTLLITALAGWWGSSVRTDSALMEMYHPGTTAWQSMRLVEEKLGGVVPVFFHLEGPPGVFRQPDALRRLDRLEQVFHAQEEVLWTGSLSGHVREVNRLLTGEDRVPATAAAVAQELLVAELFGREPFEGLVDEDFAKARVLGLVADAGGRAYRRMQADLEGQAEEIFHDSGLTVELTGDGIMAAVGLEILVKDLASSLGVVLLVIFVALFLLLRDLRLALVATVPNLVPLVFTLATIKATGGDLRVTNVVAFSVAIGLAVDDTIHFIVRYRQERAAGGDIAAAITRTYRGAGHAIVLTSILLVMGFGVMASSELTSTRDFGMLASVTMGAAILGDLFLLPAMLHLVGRRRWSSPTPAREGSAR